MGVLMKLIIITGFLGSGKTTVLMGLAQYLGRNLQPKDIVIIENEIGEANVDGRLLGETAYEVRDLTAGCICCTLSGEFIFAMEEIRRDIDPQWLLIEATGIAHQTIADIVSQSVPGLKPFSIVLVDAPRWEDLMDNLPMLVTTQVERADCILINKVDSVSEEELARVEEDVRDINDQTPLHKISAVSRDLDDIWGQVVGYAES